MPVSVETVKERKKEPEIDYKAKYEEEMTLRLKLEEELTTVKGQLSEYESQYGPLSIILPAIPLDLLPPPPEEF